MKKYIIKVKELAFSSTAKDTYVLFGGNVTSAFLGFLFILFAARFLSVANFGIFSAITNLATILTSVSDIGLSSGLINFIAEAYSKNEHHLADQYLKAAFIIKLSIVFVLAIIVFSFAPIIAPELLASKDVYAGIWTGILIISLFLWGFFPTVLQARKKFFGSISVDLSFMTVRLLSLFCFVFLGLTLYRTLGAYVVAGLISGIVGFALVGTSFIKEKVENEIYKKLLRFSGWLGVNRIISSVSGGLDIQMLAAIVGATATGLYSIPSRLASFIIVLTGSFSSVLATRLAGFGDKEKEKKYILKATLVTLPVVVGIIFWILIAKPFILFLFGAKYLPSVPIFQALAIADIPFVLTAPSVSAIIYSIKKPKFIGIFSVIQVILMFILDVVLIPRFGVFGPTITLGIINLVIAIYTWTIVIKHYWFER